MTAPAPLFFDSSVLVRKLLGPHASVVPGEVVHVEHGGSTCRTLVPDGIKPARFQELARELTKHVAIHEASHVVVDVECGIKFDYVSIRHEDPGVSGVVHRHDLAWDAALLAGMVGELVVSGYVIAGGVRGDLKAVLGFTGDYGQLRREDLDRLVAGCRHARAILERRRDDVVRLAHALVASPAGILLEAQCTAILEGRAPS
jgi:hypothetical protein